MEGEYNQLRRGKSSMALPMVRIRVVRLRMREWLTNVANNQQTGTGAEVEEPGQRQGEAQPRERPDRRGTSPDPP